MSHDYNTIINFSSTTQRAWSWRESSFRYDGARGVTRKLKSFNMAKHSRGRVGQEAFL